MKIAKELSKELCVDGMRYLGRSGTCEPEQRAWEIIAAKLEPVREALVYAYNAGLMANTALALLSEEE